MLDGFSLTQKTGMLTALGLAAGVFLSWPLWYAPARSSFPLLPIMGAAHFETTWFSILCVGLLLSSLVAVLVFSAKNIPIVVLLISVITLCCFDLNRLQPWVWMYGLILFAVLVGKSEMETRDTLRWLLAAIYAWSGFHKLTPYFAEDNFDWFCSAFSLTARLAHTPALGYTVALLEMSLAVGLMWSRTRAVFRWLVIIFHAIIILLISPLGLNWNVVVVPWNVAMAGLVWLFFADRDPSFLPKNNGQQLVLILAVIAPLFNFLGGWPEALSWKLYSNTQPEATFYAPAHSFTHTIEQKAFWEKNAFDDGTKLLLDDWANAELHTPMFASEGNFRQTAIYLCGCTTQPDSAGLYILSVHPWNRQAEKLQKIPCRQLLNLYK